jgi:hypothetical protein
MSRYDHSATIPDWRESGVANSGPTVCRRSSATGSYLSYTSSGRVDRVISMLCSGCFYCCKDDLLNGEFANGVRILSVCSILESSVEA